MPRSATLPTRISVLQSRGSPPTMTRSARSSWAVAVITSAGFPVATCAPSQLCPNGLGRRWGRRPSVRLALRQRAARQARLPGQLRIRGGSFNQAIRLQQ
jgi:hypothetical protein